jgi:hypothetical protein
MLQVPEQVGGGVVVVAETQTPPNGELQTQVSGHKKPRRLSQEPPHTTGGGVPDGRVVVVVVVGIGVVVVVGIGVVGVAVVVGGAVVVVVVVVGATQPPTGSGIRPGGQVGVPAQPPGAMQRAPPLP